MIGANYKNVSGDFVRNLKLYKKTNNHENYSITRQV